MKKIIKTFALQFIVICVLFSTKESSASLKPVAEAVKEKHDLNITFLKQNLFKNVRPATDERIRTALTSGTSAEIISSKLSGLVKQAPATITLNIPFDGKMLSIDLVSVNIFTEDFSVLTSDKEPVNYNPGVYYRGTIKGNPNSVASFSFFNDQLFGIISDDALGNITVGRIVRPGNTSEYIIYSDRNLIQPLSNYCNTPDVSEVILPKYELPYKVSSSTTNCVRLYYEVDNDIYQYNGSNTINTTNWITAVHNNVATLFANDNISVTFSQAFIWTTNDPYDGADSDIQLALFHANRPSFNGDVGQLVSKNDGFTGIADTINGLCTTKNYCFTDIDFDFETVPVYSYTIEVITHEFGHIMGSRHTHNCLWPGGAIDNCGPLAGFPTEGGCTSGPSPSGGGTIMSFCHLVPAGINFTKGFGPLPKAAIISAVDNAPCLGTTCAPCPAPAHNSCSTPAILRVSSSCNSVYGSLCGATESIAPITCNSRTAASAKDVWYSFVPTQADLVVKVQSGTNTDAVVALYSGGCAGLTLLSCADANLAGGLETITAAVTVGATYLIRVYDFNGGAAANFGICLKHNCVAVTNDECANAIPLNMSTTCNFFNGELCSATQSMFPEDCSGFSSTDALDLFFSITPPQDSVVITVQSGPNTDMVLAIYEGPCAALNLLQCTDTVSSGGTENISIGLTAGVTYYVRVYDWNANLTGSDFRICARYIQCATPVAPSTATATFSTICSGSTSTLNVSGSLSAGASWHWYSGTCGGTPLGTGSFIVVSPSATTNYFVRAQNGTCFSICRNVTVNVIQDPAAPTSALSAPLTICSGNSSTLTVSGTLTSGASWQWYSGSCGGTPEGSGASISVSPTITTDYFVRAENGICLSACVNATINVNTTPGDPVSATGNSPVCAGTATTLQVNGTLTAGATWRWYSGSCNGTPVGTGSSVVVSPAATTTYFVRAETATCFSNCSNVTINVNTVPSAPSAASASPTSICSVGASSTLTVTGILSPGAAWQWYSGSCGGTPAGSGTSITVSPAVTTNYFVRAESGSCFSACASTTLNVATTPNNPVSATGTSPICSGTSTTLQVNGTLSAGATWKWYSVSCGGTAAGTGASVVVSPATTTTYFVRAENGACFSTCSSITINVTASPATPTSANALPASICSVGGSSILTVSGTLSAGATWHWYTGTCGGTPAGTGASITVSPSSTTNYFVRAENGTCSSPCVNVTLAVATTPSNPVSATGTSPICSGINTTLQVNGTLSTGATWRWYSGTCGGTSVGTGASLGVSPTTSTTYFVRAENAGCFSTCSSVAITVNPTPAAPTSAVATPASLCTGGSTTLTVNGTLSAGAAWHWYSGSCGGTPVGTGASLSVSPTSTTNYFVRAQNGNCFSACVNTAVTVTTTPNNPVSATGTSTICSGSSSTLQVNGTLSAGATWRWYSGSCGGTPAGTGASVVVSPVSNTTYYVRAENGSCFSTCSSILITVNASPAAPDSAIASLMSICSAGGSSTLNVTGTLSAGATWHWYTSTCGGTPAGMGTSLTVTPSTTTNYFVRAENANCNSVCETVTVSVGSIPNDPDSIIDAPPACAGTNSVLQVLGTLSPGSTWNWFIDSCRGVVADTGEFVTFAPTVTTFYYVRAENNGCFSNCISTSIDVIPNPSDPQPINTSASVLCFGDSSILTEIGIPAPGSDWYWYTDSCGGTPAGQGNSIIIHPSATTIYYVRAEDSNCNSLCEAVSIIVNPIPPQPVIVLSHDTLIAPLYPSYQWFFGMDSLSFTLAGTDQNQKVAIDGYYFVVITDANGCTASSDTVLVEDPLLVSERKSDNYLSVYPNPTYDLLNIKMNKAIVGEGLIKIFDTTGRLVYGSKFSGDKINTISLASFADGMYQVVFSIDGKVFLRKILKQ